MTPDMQNLPGLYESARSRVWCKSYTLFSCVHPDGPRRRQQNGDATNRLSGLCVRMAPWYGQRGQSALPLPKGLRPAGIRMIRY